MEQRNKNWLNQMFSEPVLIAGPCSIESEDQIVGVARDLKKRGAHLLRGGIWKPRTRPNSFEGLGTIALPWLKKASVQAGLPCMIEVASAEHVELALAYEVDMIWIGARSTVNPFTVQSIADALQGVDIPVWVKNPVNPDLNLWIGAIERIQNSGIKKIAAIHRGFSSYGNKKYRNPPHWEIPIELRRLLPELPMICDPSHIGGSRELLLEIAQYALHLNYGGLMMEVHPDPDLAWTDSKQQILPSTWQSIILQLFHPQDKKIEAHVSDKLQKLRTEIDAVDFEILELISKRMEIVKKIGAHKFINQLSILQLERWNEIKESRAEKMYSYQFESNFLDSFLGIVHQESIRIQSDIFEELKKKDNSSNENH